MSKIAIDAVLLPLGNVIDKAIEINNKLINDPIKLSAELYLGRYFLEENEF